MPQLNDYFKSQKKKNPAEIIIISDKKVAKVAVTVDGTWQRRGHTSKIGVVFIISVETGEVLDAVTKSLFCGECSKATSKFDLNSPEIRSWFQGHKEQCCINHTGASGAMETEGAVELFLRLIEKRGLMYSTFVGDGDSDCFGHVKESCEKLNIGYYVAKEECVGHIQKRLGTALREYKRKNRGRRLEDGKAIGGKNRLTDNVIDKLQNYFGEAIRNNTNNIDSMENDIWAILTHTVKEDSLSLDLQHAKCPRSSWCKYWSDREHYDDGKRLPSVFFNELKPMFTRLSQKELLGRCLKGLTQNQNEAINGMLWRRCPKTKFCGERKVELAVVETIIEFNSGAAGIASVQEASGVSISSNMMKAIRKLDKSRIQRAAQKISEKARTHSPKEACQSQIILQFHVWLVHLVWGKAPEIDLNIQIAPNNNAVKPKQRNIHIVPNNNAVKPKQRKQLSPAESPEMRIELTFVDERNIPKLYCSKGGLNIVKS